MLKYRLIFGLGMFLLVWGLFFLDNQLDQIDLTGTSAQKVFLGRHYLPAGLLLLLAFIVMIGLATRELCRIFYAKQIAADPFMIWLSGTLGCVLIYIIPYTLDSQATIAIYASLMVLMFILALIRHGLQRKPSGAVTVAGVTMLSLIYIGILPGFYLAIRRWHSAWVIAALILVAKSCDIGAYFTGKAMGRHKLIPWLSPGKTWEGLAGGLIFSSLLAVGLAAIGNHYHFSGRWQTTETGRVFVEIPYPLWFAAVAGLTIGLAGQFGDLIASLFKRDAGIKDSGKSIPGFGGLLDVIDSTIIAAPVAYWLLQMATLLK